MSATGEQERARQAAARRRAADLRAAAAAKQRLIRAAELELGLVRSHLGPGPGRTRFADGALVPPDPDPDQSSSTDEDPSPYVDMRSGAGYSGVSRDACHEGECGEVTDAEQQKEHDLLGEPVCGGGSSQAEVDHTRAWWLDAGRAAVVGVRGGSKSGSGSGSGRVRRSGGYVPSYRERFLADDGLECWHGDLDPPPAGIPGVLGSTIIAVVIVDRDSLDRGLRGVRNAAAKRDARACLAAALDGAAADAAATVERCLLQHAIIGAHQASHEQQQLVKTSITAKLCWPLLPETISLPLTELRQMQSSCAGARSAAMECTLREGVTEGQRPDCSGAGSWRCFAAHGRHGKRARCHYGLLGSPAAAAAYLATPPREPDGQLVLEQLPFDAEHLSADELAPQASSPPVADVNSGGVHPLTFL